LAIWKKKISAYEQKQKRKKREKMMKRE